MYVSKYHYNNALWVDLEILQPLKVALDLGPAQRLSR